MHIIDKILIVSLLLKFVTGYRFPWEKCDCCGERLGKHHKSKGGSHYESMDQIEKENDRLIDDLP